MPSVEELMAFYRANKGYIDLIVENAVKNNPEMKQMRERLAFNDELKEFEEEFPQSGIHSAGDLAQLKEIGQILRYLKMGLRLSQAYKLCNFSTLMENAGKEGSMKELQREREKRAKAHLKATGAASAEKSCGVPEDVKELYHALLSDWSDGEILKDYAKRRKE